MIVGSKTLSQLSTEASVTAHGYLERAISSVNELLGEGSALKHPELIAALVSAAAKDYEAAVLTHYVCPALEDIATAIRGAGDDIRAGLAE